MINVVQGWILSFIGQNMNCDKITIDASCYITHNDWIKYSLKKMKLKCEPCNFKMWMRGTLKTSNNLQGSLCVIFSLRMFATSYVATLFHNACSFFIRGTMYTSKLCIFTNALPLIITTNMRNIFLVISPCEILQLKIRGQVYYVFFFSPKGFIPSLTSFNITLQDSKANYNHIISTCSQALLFVACWTSPFVLLFSLCHTTKFDVTWDLIMCFKQGMRRKWHITLDGMFDMPRLLCCDGFHFGCVMKFAYTHLCMHELLCSLVLPLELKPSHGTCL